MGGRGASCLTTVQKSDGQILIKLLARPSVNLKCRPQPLSQFLYRRLKPNGYGEGAEKK